jgi:acyl-CoA dehydrogenase
MMWAVFATYREQSSDCAGPVTGASMGWDLQLWKQLSELGLARLTGSEATGGSGGSWYEAAQLLRSAASNGLPTPFVEHDLLAGWLLERAGLPVDDARRTACILDQRGTAHSIGWATAAEKVVVVFKNADTFFVADVDTADLTIVAGTNSVGEPRDTVIANVTALQGKAITHTVVDEFTLRGALARTIQVGAALEQALAISITHAKERVQFGRPLAKFQAIQHLIADMAAETALCHSATDAALSEAVETNWSSPNLLFLNAIARSCAGHAASTVVRNAHQVLGAIGTTAEHQLHRFTLPALAWRSEFGSLHHWDCVVSTTALTRGADGLWPLIVD